MMMLPAGIVVLVFQLGFILCFLSNRSVKAGIAENRGTHSEVGPTRTLPEDRPDPWPWASQGGTASAAPVGGQGRPKAIRAKKIKT